MSTKQKELYDAMLGSTIGTFKAVTISVFAIGLILFVGATGFYMIKRKTEYRL